MIQEIWLKAVVQGRYDSGKDVIQKLRKTHDECQGEDPRDFEIEYFVTNLVGFIND